MRSLVMVKTVDIWIQLAAAALPVLYAVVCYRERREIEGGILMSLFYVGTVQVISCAINLRSLRKVLRHPLRLCYEVLLVLVLFFIIAAHMPSHWMEACAGIALFYALITYLELRMARKVLRHTMEIPWREDVDEQGG